MYSSLPTPTISGEPLRATTSTSGLLLADHGDRVGAGDLAQGRLDRALEVAVVQLADQVREHLGVGVRLRRRAPSPAR